MQYTINKTHINQLTPEQKQKLRDIWTPEKGQQIMLERGRVYTIKAVTSKKIKVGSFEVVKDKVLPILTESDLIHGLASVCPSVLMGYGENIADDDVVETIWDVTVTDALTGGYYDGETLLEALWEAYKEIILS